MGYRDKEGKRDLIGAYPLQAWNAEKDDFVLLEVVSDTGALKVSVENDITISATGAIGKITVDTVTVEATAEGTALANRKGIRILNDSANMLYWSYASPTTEDDMPINPGMYEELLFDYNQETAIYLIADTTSTTVRIHEWK